MAEALNVLHCSKTRPAIIFEILNLEVLRRIMVSVCLFIQLPPGLLTYSQDYFDRPLCVLASTYVR